MKKKRKVIAKKRVAKRRKVVRAKKVVRKTKAVKVSRRGRPKGSKNKTQLLTPTLAIAPVPVLAETTPVLVPEHTITAPVVATPELLETSAEIPLNTDGTKTDTEP